MRYDVIYLLTAVVLTSVAVVRYTFAHKKYTEQHNKTEYPERNIQIQISFLYKHILIRNKSKSKNLKQSLIKMLNK